jgi:hypothetical protein
MLVSVASFLPILIVGPIADALGTTVVLMLVATAITASGLASIFMRGALKPAERGSRYDVGNRDPIAAALRAGEVPTPDVQDSAIAVGQRVKKRADAATTSGDDSTRPS